MSSNINHSIKQKLLFLVFFLSGFAALLYQVIWQRWLVFFTGIGSVSISLIVSAFMAGLGLGYWYGGILADKAPKNKQILYFILAELGIGLFALMSKYILYDFLYGTGIIQSNSHLQTYFILFLILLVPTFLMGMSLPLLSKSLKLQNHTQQARFISNLYFINTLGAAFGALLTGMFIIRLLGFEIAIYLGVIFNLTCAILSSILYNKERKVNSSIEDDKAQNSAFIWDKTFIYWLIQYALSGFMAICFELIWFRILDVSIKSISMTFAIVLFVYLFSMAIGTQFGIWYLKKTSQNLTKLFLRVQYFLYLYCISAIVALLYAVTNWSSLEYLRRYFNSYETSYQASILLITYGVIPVFLMAVPTFLMGLSFSISQSIIQDNFHNVGRKVGWLQFINIIGASVGAWFISLVGFPILHTSLSIQVISALGFIYVFILIKNRYGKLWLNLSAAIFLFGTIYALPGYEKFWKTLNGTINQEIIFDEDDTALSAIKLGKVQHTVFINGLGQSELPFKTDDIHIALGAIPSLLHPSPKDIAIIGLGSGGTLFNSLGHKETKQVDCFEVIVNQPKILRKYGKIRNDKTIDLLLNDPRVNLIYSDGRFEIQNNVKKYDIIEADALRPKSAFSGNIYSKEYFELLKKHLNKGGIVATWKPTERVRKTLQTVFPYIIEIDKILLIGSSEPFASNMDSFLLNANDPFSIKHFKNAEIDIVKTCKPFLAKQVSIQNTISKDISDINTDMFPKDEYDQLYLLLERLSGGKK